MSKNKGISLLEVVLSFTVLIIVATILFSAFTAFRGSNDLESAHSEILGILKDARARTLASQSNTRYGVHFATERAVLFKGVTYSSSATDNESYVLPPTVTISSISLTGSAVDTVFSRLYGTTTASGTVTLTGRNNRAKTITILSTGITE